MATIGENIRRRREMAGFATQKEFAAALGKPQSHVSDWETSRYKLPDTASLIEVAKILDCSLDDFLVGVDRGYDKAAGLERREADGVEDELIDVSGHTVRDIPVIAEGDTSPQGGLFWDDEGLRPDVEDRITRPYDVRDPKAYGVRVRSDSMMPAYKPGMVLVVSPNTPAENGDEVYVQLLSGERLLKAAQRLRGGWLLESINRAYETRFVKKSEIGAMHPVLWARRRK
jgi:phage repressor protein C with HTH and peptisase S24 domain